METRPETTRGNEPTGRARAVVNSALWAAAGDALGWITELSRGPASVEYRTGSSSLTEPVNWQRLIGGKGGPRVDLPSGTYSDDTQLRLAVCRSIRGDASFDAETFAKIELTVWPTYALGGGLGTKAAALNLSRRTVNWFSNFFDSGGQKYVNGGGNGAAMRIQPHVWSATHSDDRMILNVLRDALITHGHPHGFCGAVFHALCLAETIDSGRVPEPKSWQRHVDRLADVPRLVTLDPQLEAFWQTAWEKQAGGKIGAAIEGMVAEARYDLEIIARLPDGSADRAYHKCLVELGCLTPKYRGSGFKTALAAAYLAHTYRDQDPGVALLTAANELESDTDTIATMAGALLGAIAVSPPLWSVQDRGYIVSEAVRLAKIARGEPQDSFTYPDLGRWNPPAKQIASIGWCDGKLAIAGLGILESIGKEYQSGDAIWQWFMLPFGQSIIAKRKANLKEMIDTSQLPGVRHQARAVRPSLDNRQVQTRLPLGAPPIGEGRSHQTQRRLTEPNGPTFGDNIDAWTDEIIRSNFDPLLIGQLMNRCIETTSSIELAVSFSAIIAKAKIARQKRPR